jgi:hypothetical protein
MDDELQGLIALVVIAVGGVCMATGVLSTVVEMLGNAVRGLF